MKRGCGFLAEKKTPECFGKYGLTDDCFGCLLAVECEELAKEEAEDYGLETSE